MVNGDTLRTLSFDYVAPSPDFLSDADWDCLHDALVAVFEQYGLRVDGASDGPTT